MDLAQLITGWVFSICLLLTFFSLPPIFIQRSAVALVLLAEILNKKVQMRFLVKSNQNYGYPGSVFVLNLNTIILALWADSRNFLAPLQMTLTLPQFSSKHIQARVDPHMCTYIWLC